MPAEERPRVNVFVSYARRNRRLALDFIERLEDQLSASLAFEYRLWWDEKILVGETWHDAIQEAIDSSALGLLLVSPSFLGSKYIGDHELPQFVGRRARPVMPVLIQPVDFKLQNLKGLKERQIFRLPSLRSNHPKAYGEVTGHRRDAFALALFQEIERKLARLFR